MSFLNPGAGAAGGNAAASGLGHLFGADPSRVSDIAGRIGMGANQIAQAGGATPGYAAPEINNHLQLLNSGELQSIIDRFKPMPLTADRVTPMARAPGGFY